MSDRKPLISGNWKMHKNHLEALQTVQKLSYLLTDNDFDAVDVSIHPPFVDLRTVQTWIDSEELKILIGAQNCHWEEKGAFTGEIAPAMLAKLTCSYVIVGHSERREIFGETNDEVNRKVKAVFDSDMTPIMCVGETLEEREGERTEAKVSLQVEAGLAGLKKDQVAAMVIAYEPIWAIGTGRTASPEDAQAVCGLVRRLVEERFSGAGEAVRVQYGGSVKPTNAGELMSQPDIDGALVGGASLEPDDFARVIQYRLHHV